MTATRIGSVVPRREQRVFGYLLAALLVETLFFVVLSPLLPLYARQLHLTPVGAGVLSASYAIGYGLAAVPAGAPVRRPRPRPGPVRRLAGGGPFLAPLLVAPAPGAL